MCGDVRWWVLADVLIFASEALGGGLRSHDEYVMSLGADMKESVCAMIWS